MRPFSSTFLALVIVFVLIPPVAAAAGGGPFIDDDGSPHEASIAALWTAEIASGCGLYRFCPDSPVTRAEAATFLARALGLPAGGAAPFADVSGVHSASITALFEAGITSGCAPGMFCPERALTRWQMASLLARALNLPPSAEDFFYDDDALPQQSDINRLAAAGITVGCRPDRFCPYGALTRAELASLLVRALDLPVPNPLPPHSAEAVALKSVLSHRWFSVVSQHFYPTDVPRALEVIDCESRGNPYAVNHSSRASGLFQHLPKYWAQRSASAGVAGASIFDPHANTAVAAWLVYHAGGWDHWSPTASCWS